MKNWIFATLRSAGWAPLAVFVFYVIAAKGFSLYLIYPNMEIPTHFIEGIAITYFHFTAINYSQPLVGTIPKIVQLVLGSSLTAFTAVIWEFLEELADLSLGTKMNLGVYDTLSDLFFGLL